MKIYRLSFMILVGIGAVSVTYMVTSCEHEPVYIDQSDTICFEEEVLPIYQISCGISGCHGNGSAQEGFDATQYATIMQYIKAGEPKQSKAYTVLTNLRSDDLMPPGKPLSKEQRSVIQLWILQGAKNTTCNDTIIPPEIPTVDTTPEIVDTICFNQDILPLIQSSCATTQCHDAVTQREGYNLSSYSKIMSYEKLIIPFDTTKSKLIRVITDNEDDDRMPPPPRSPLSEEQIQMLTEWINDGALESDCQFLACDTNRTMSFSSDIWPIVNNYCLSCHSGTSPSGGISLNNYTQIKAIVDMQRENISVFPGVIKQLNNFSAMPQGSKLSDCNIAKIEKWINNSAPNN